MLLAYVRARLGVSDEKGQTLVEYALIIALVSVVLVAALKTMTTALDGIFSFISSTLNAAVS